MNWIIDFGLMGVCVFWMMFLLSIGVMLLGLFVFIGAMVVICLCMQLFVCWFVGVSVALVIVFVVGVCMIGYVNDGI